MLMRQDLIKWVNQELRNRGWSISELARRGGVNQSYISAVLSGRQNPGPKFYLSVSRAFGFTSESLERLEANGVIPQSNINSVVYQDLLEIAKELSLEDLTEVRDYAIYRMRKSKNLPL